MKGLPVDIEIGVSAYKQQYFTVVVDMIEIYAFVGTVHTLVRDLKNAVAYYFLKHFIFPFV